MTPDDLRALRDAWDLTQKDMAEKIGLSLRQYQSLEGGEFAIRRLHELAIERVSITIALERGDPILATTRARNACLTLWRLETMNGAPANG